MRDGSVIFFKNGAFNRSISRQTNSPLTHVAIIIDDLVYESVIPRVRRIAWNQYQWEIVGEEWFILQPCTPYSSNEKTVMKQFAESQLDRRYMVRGWYLEREARGVFCSEYVADIIEKSGRMISAHYNESPGSLYEKLLKFYEISTN